MFNSNNLVAAQKQVNAGDILFFQEPRAKPLMMLIINNLFIAVFFVVVFF